MALRAKHGSVQRCRNVGPGPWEMMCALVCVCTRVRVHTYTREGKGYMVGVWGFRDCQKADTHPPPPATVECFLLDSPPSAGKDWSFGCQGVCVGREKCKWGDWKK